MATNYCKADLFESKALTALKRIVGADENLLYSIVSECVSYDKFTEGFQEYFYKDAKQDVDFNLGNGIKVANRMLAYYKSRHPDLNDTVRERTKHNKVTDFGYGSILDREEGKDHMSTAILIMFDNVQQFGVEIKGNPIDYYTGRLKAQVEDNVLKAISKDTNIPIETLSDELDEANDRTAYLESKLGKNPNVSTKNLLAIYKELTASPKTVAQYIDELFCNPVLQPVFAENKDALDEYNDSVGDTEIADSTIQGQEAYVADVDDLDHFIGLANSHAGLHSSFMKHVSVRIKTYFDTLPKLSSTTKVTNDDGAQVWQVDTNNRFGLLTAMGAERCCNMLYGGSSNYNSIQSMIKYVRTIGETVKGFESFVKFAEDLESDPDFAYEVFTVFAKTVMEKVQVVVNSGDSVVRVSNQRASKHSAFIFNLMNDIKATAIDVDPVWMKDRIIELSNDVNTLINDLKSVNDKDTTKSKKDRIKSTKDAQYDNICRNIIKLLKLYYPSVDDAAIVSFIEIDKNAGTDIIKRLSNVKALLNTLSNTQKASVKTARKYIERAAIIKEYQDDNRAVEFAANKGRFRSFEDYHDMSEAYAIDYIDQDQKKAYIELCNMLVKYSVVNLQLTSPNVKGNNQSSVMNNSFITTLKKLLNSTYTEYERDDEGKIIARRTVNKAILNWGKDKLKDARYRESTILLEHRDEQGNIINHGIFRYNANGELTLTEDGPRLLDVALFDGSSDMDKGSNVQYKEMTQGSFFPTAYVQFFKAEQVEGSSVKTARYFPRTPSDSTTMFSIQAPRYDTSDLYRIKDDAELDRIVQQAIDDIPVVNPKQFYGDKAPDIDEPEEPLDMTFEEYKNGYQVKQTLPLIANRKEGQDNTEVEITTLGQFILGKGEIQVPQAFEGGKGSRFAKEPGTTNKYRIRVTYGNNHYVFVGDKRKKGKLDVLRNFKLKAIVPKKGNGAMPEQLVDYLKSQLKGRLRKGNIVFNGHTYNQPELEINTQAQVFQVYKQQFKQELLEMAIALDHYFEVDDDGWVIDGDKHNEKSTKQIKVKTITRIEDGKEVIESLNEKGINFYHLDEDGKVLSGNRGKYKLGGKVWHSSKFTLSKTKLDSKGNEVEVKENYLDECISTGVEPLGKDRKPKNDGKIHLLYGGALGSYLHVIRDNKAATAKKPIIGIRLTKEQEELVDQQIAKYINDYIAQFEHYTDNNQQFIKGVEVNRANIVEFAINSNIFLMQSDDLLDGSSKFYKDAQTILKRAKEYEGSGVPYGLVDYFDEDVEDKIIANSYLNTGSFQHTRWVKEQLPGDLEVTKKIVEKRNIQDFLREHGLHDCRQRKEFKGVTVRNTKSTNTTLLKELANQLAHESHIDENLAQDILFGPIKRDEKGKIVTVDGTPDGEPVREGGFQETKVNDAQSYITLEEWIRRIAARGQLKRYMPLVEKLLDETRKLSAEDIKEFIQVQKNFYYDLHYDEEYGIERPRQIKNAEMVLVPRLIRGTQLQRVYELMIESGVDQLNTLETSKASNKNVLTLWDNDGNLVGENSFVKEAQEAKETYYYKYLYTQQETPQHMNATNKAGIQIVKKIIDNIPEGHPLYDKKVEYMQLFVQNIRDSYTTLMDELEVERDDAGNIIIEDGVIKGFNREMFYNKLKDELRRLGLDSNLIDYVTLDENGIPRMPAHMNNVITKLESIVQSMFNSSITRQRLPGFHAAQVTNVGWRRMGTDIDGVSYNKDLKYHPEGYRHKTNQSKVISERQYNKLSDKEKSDYEPTRTNYIEVMLPASVFGIDKNAPHYKNMTDEQILEELEEEGLDLIMGYRIPTEGKQSVCNMKVVGFVDDAYGSTIIVPNEWVAQTGSDFDIDSVYGINYETYKDKTGKINKVKYFDDNSTITWEDYLQYVTHEVKHLLSKDVRDEAKDNLKTLRKQRNERYEELAKEQNDLFESLQEIVPNFIKNIKKCDAQTKRKIAEEQPHLLSKEYKLEYNKEILKAKLETTNTFLDVFKKRPTFVEAVTPYKEVLEKFIKFFDGDYEAFENASEDEILKLAHAANLPSYSEFASRIKSDPVSANSRAARNNRILDNMKDILNHPSSLEENLSRSNFDDIIYWRNQVMNDNVKIARNNRSSYNPIDQFRYQEDAMSGATLKGFSVSLDTFCSVCNTVRPTLSKPVYIVYDSADFEDKKSIKSRFNQVKAEDGKKTFSIRHDTYGWSKDNRAVNGKLLTAHSSQTTAHILDAIKEGAIPGVNEFTFGVYKTFLNIGSDYKTAISFIMQPGVDRIVQAYNANNSVFSSYRDNPIHQAIRSIAQDLIKAAREDPKYNKEEIADIDTKAPVVSILASLNKIFGKDFNKIFHQAGDEDLTISFSEANLANLPILVPELYNRLKGKGRFKNSSPVEEMLFDLGNILAYHRLNKIARTVGDIAQCCNPDKFGAKQTVFATNKVFDDIRDALTADNQGSAEPRDPLLYVEKGGERQHILLSIYPGVDKGTDENPAQGVINNTNVMDSSYPTLYAYLKYATATSTIIAKDMFLTQSLPFVRAVKGITSVMSGFRPRLDEATYTDLQKYMLSYYYNNVESIKHPIRMIKDEYGYIPSIVLGQVKEVDGKQIIVADDKEGSALDERTRVFGFNCTPNVDFEVEDINDPTQEELNAFAQLSPAQKVEWLKSYLRASNDTIFGLIRQSLYNDRRRLNKMGMQTLEYTDENINPNVVYGEFYKAFYNDNPFIQMTAIDMIKYAVLVEGLRMTSTGITKIIDNEPLIEEFGIDGLGFIDELNIKLSSLDKPGGIGDPETSKIIYERYLRSHPDCPNIKRIYMTKANESKYGFSIGTYGIVYSPIDSPTNEIDAETAKKNWFEKLREAGVVMYNEAGQTLDDQYQFNSYIRIKKGNKDTLYKIKPLPNDGVVMYPLSPLEANETTKFSAKPENNKGIPPKNVYEKLISMYQSDTESKGFDNSVLIPIVEEMMQAGLWEEYKEPVKPNKVKAREFDVEQIENVVDPIRKHFSQSNDTLYIKNLELTNYIFSTDPRYGIIQNVTMPNGTVRQFNIVKVQDKGYKDKYLAKNKKTGKYKLTDAEFNALLATEPDAQIRSAIQEARDTGLSAISNLFAVVPTVQTMNATTEESDSAILNYLTVEARNDNELAVEALNTERFNGVDATETSVKDNTVTILRSRAKFAKFQSQKLISDFEHFVKDPLNPDVYLKMNDDRVQPLLQGDAKLLNKYQTLINTVTAFKDTFGIYKLYDEEGKDADIDHYIKDIHKSLKDIEELAIVDAANKLADGYYSKLSNNTLIKTNLIKIMDGYYKTYGSMWQFNDIMEAGNPLLQTILKDVMGNIESKRLATQRRIDNFHAKRDAIIKEAKEEGYDIDINKCIDSDGRRYRPCTAAFDEKITELRQAMLSAAENYGMGSVEHLQAKLEFDIFKAKYVNQEVVPEYYIDKASWDKTILNRYPELFSKYKKLRYEQADIYSYTDGELSDEAIKRLKEIDLELTYLLNPYYDLQPDGVIVEKKQPDEEAVRYLQAYIEAEQDRKEKYFEYSGAYGFEELVAKNRAIVIAYENRDKNGIPEKPITVLMKDPIYANAKNWLSDNAYFQLKPSQYDKDVADSVYNKIQKALKTLGRSNGGKIKTLNQLIKDAKLNRNVNIRDEHGVVDGRLLTDIERSVLKSTTQDGYLIPISDGSDKKLISSAPESKYQYSKVFWLHITPNVSFKGTPLPDTKENMDKYLDEFTSGRTILNYYDWRVWNGDLPRQNYYALVTELNNLIEPYYRHSDGVVHFEDISDDKEGVELLNKIAELYQKLRFIEKGDNLTEEQEEERSKWMEENVEEQVNRVAYLQQNAAMKEKSPEWQAAWKLVNLERKQNGDIVVTPEHKVVPNKRLYSYLKPKGEPGTEQHDKWVDSALTEAIQIVNQYYTKTETVYYKQAQAEAINRAKTDPSFDYEQWYKDNHVYNPYTRRYEPLDCWTTSEFNQAALNEAHLKGEWVPKGRQRNTKVKDGMIDNIYVESMDMRNHKYKEGAGLSENYAGVDLTTGKEETTYKNPIQINKYEQKMLDLIQDELVATGRNQEQREHWGKGWMPIEKLHKESMGKRIATESGKFFGLSINKKEAMKQKHNDLDYVKDELPPMPMSQLIRDVDAGTVDFNRVEPRKYDYIKNGTFDKEAYNKDHKEWEDAKTEALKKNKEVHQALLNRDWWTVLDNYFERAGEYNAVQDNKQKLYYLLNMLSNQKVCLREHDAYGNLKKVNDRVTHGEDKVYDTTIDEALLKQYKVFMQRLLFGQWKDDEGFLTDLGTRAQGLTSASYMMMNIKGGISNITLGETGIFAEAVGKELFGRRNWGFGTKEWTKSIIPRIRGMYSDTSYCKQDAIIKFFRVVDYDEIRGVSTEFDMEKYSERIRNFMFSPQTIGEDFMQNSVLFAMLKSHKIIDIENDPLGIGKTYMSERDYINYRMAQELNDILTEEQQEAFAKWKEEIKSDKDKLAEYAWWRRDVLTDFVYLHCHKSDKAKREGKTLSKTELKANRNDHDAQLKEFLSNREKLEDKFKKEFAQKEDMYSQCELGDNGKLAFKEGSDLHDLQEQFVGGEDVTGAEALLGRFTERVRKVNNRIHGVYNKMGRAYIEKRWFGSIVMQYHKHLPIGLLKRYRNRGYFNEFRGTVDKGMIWSVIDFLSLNADKVKLDYGWTQDNVNAIKSLQFLIRHSLDYIAQIKTTWDIIPEYERANIKRNLGDLVGVLAGLLTVIGLIAYDDDNDNVFYNLWLYEGDRLAAEAFLYNPLGLWTETKTLMSTPVAAQSILSDALKAILNITNYDETFQTGRFAGQNKLKVYLTRRIPVYGGIRSLLALPDNNHYYKIGDTASTIVPTREIGEWIGDIFH